jgi:hypothetical protein
MTITDHLDSESFYLRNRVTDAEKWEGIVNLEPEHCTRLILLLEYASEFIKELEPDSTKL